VFSNLSMDDPLNERIALIPCFRYLDSLTWNSKKTKFESKFHSWKDGFVKLSQAIKRREIMNCQNATRPEEAVKIGSTPDITEKTVDCPLPGTISPCINNR
jgi:hypothetical protein